MYYHGICYQYVTASNILQYLRIESWASSSKNSIYTKCSMFGSGYTLYYYRVLEARVIALPVALLHCTIDATNTINTINTIAI